ncbi:uncharacterized protein N0V89_012518 [Didymosphaeria variabile]|uniref:Uncharacterized protein n=1 Tax=Didymosphaeria variabile TaxID=1932322 RepID=A0A9W9C533_9PLEO|nr:uncharacterized protein N0V89_012518 [Didymosphaeria variabile]KAJ4344774.1 hypothetical protein N0V89_012518 [Didymosphaeria variabile]
MYDTKLTSGAAPQGYQSAAPQAQSQWAAPTQAQTPIQQQWGQPQQQAAGGYNPGTYGAMPGGYSQAQQTPTQTATAYHSQQQDVPPPPPPKPAAFAASSQQTNTQNWGQQTGYGAQQNTGYTTQGQQVGYAQPSGYQSQGATQQSYNTAAPPPPSQTPGGSYFPPSQTPQAGGRPGSIYGTDQAGTYAAPSSAVAQHPPSSVLSPNEHNPAYIPPSLTGQGVQSYVPSNTNPMPGVYVPPPPDIPAWQQASHAPLQGGKKFKYTKPAPIPNLYGQGQQGVPQGQNGQQAAYPAHQYGQNQYVGGGQAQQMAPYGQPVQSQYTQGQAQQQGQYGGDAQSQYGQPVQQAQYSAHPAPPYQHPQDQSTQPQPYQQQQQSQWQPTPPADHNYTQQQTWQPGHQNQGSVVGQQYLQGHSQGIEAPTPIGRQTGTTPPGFVNEPSPQSQPVSPLQHRVSTDFTSAGLGRQGSVSSIALGAIHAQRAGNRTESPKPQPPKLPVSLPPRDPATKFSALGTGGPSDWEHFGGAEEVDDEELFGAKRDGRQGVPVQLDSMEVPSQQVSPPRPQGEWPTPPVQPASTASSNRDNYEPTPPLNAQGPPSQPPPQGFAMGDTPLSPPPQQSFVIGDAAAATQSHPQQNFVVDDAVVAPLRVSRPSSQGNTPAQQQAQHPPPPAANTSFAIDDSGWVRQRTPQANEQQASASHAAELKTKDEALERLRADAEQKETDLHAEIEQLKVVIETTKTHAEYERNVLAEQIESMKAAAQQTKTNTDAANKEKDLTIGRWKEDSEGKEDTIMERDAEINRLRDELRTKEDTIAKGHTVVDDLKKQLEVRNIEIDNLKQQIENNQTAEGLAKDLKQQLEAERLKEPPKPTPGALIPDLDPWYAGSLERYITMLRSEAQEVQVEDKINVFTGFLKAESSARGLDYHNAPPPQPVSQPPQENVQPPVVSHTDLTASTKASDLNVQVPPMDPLEEDDIQYSPGGRPIVQHRPTLKTEGFSRPHQSFSVSSQSTTVLTPTSSQDDSASKTPTSVQSPPTEPQTQSQYKAYVPSNVTLTDPVLNMHRQSLSSTTPPVLNPALSYGTKKDEVFFGAPTGTSSPSSRPNTGASATPDVQVPAPLFTQHPLAIAAKSAPKANPVDKLIKLLPTKVGMPRPNPQLEALRKKLAEFPSDLPSLQAVTVPWEKSASLVRKKNDEARRKRQEESEQETDQLFNDHEISYADIAVIEDEFKEKESKLKADEDRNEYQSYVETVFDKVYGGLQQQIKYLMDLSRETEGLLSTAVSGVKSFEGSDAATVEDCLKLLEDLFPEIEQRHDKVVEAVVQRDKRYKKTEIQPLYAAGNITKMRQVEKHFANAEKEAAQRARTEKADRVAEFVRMVEATVITAVGVEQQEIQEIITAVRDLPSSLDNEKLRARAKETVLALGDSSKALLMLLNDIEIDIGGSILEAELAEAKSENQPEKVARLEKQILDREKELKEEIKRKEAVLDQDRNEIDELAQAEVSKPADGGGVELSEEELKKERLSKALEAAKRRNGDL